jgi:hypothetical protein
MKRFIWIIIVLSIALILSNAFWLYNSIDASVTAMYQEQTFQDNHEALAQTLAIIPILTRPDSTKERVLEAAKNSIQDNKYFIKDGFIWIGKIGLKFDKNDRLVEVVPAWDPF